MDWEARLLRDAVRARFADFSLLYVPSVRPPVPKEYDVPGIVGLTFRYRKRPDGAWEYATVLDLPAVLRMGERLGFEPGQALAMVDSHERLHVALQLEGVAEEDEERQLHLADAVWLSLHHPRAAKLLRIGDFGLVTRVGPGFWEALVEEERTDTPDRDGLPAAGPTR